MKNNITSCVFCTYFSSRSGVTSLADSSHGGGGPDSGVFTNGGLSQSDIDMLNRLKEAFNKQASQLHSYESELAQRLTDIQSVSFIILGYACPYL